MIVIMSCEIYTHLCNVRHFYSGFFSRTIIVSKNLWDLHHLFRLKQNVQLVITDISSGQDNESKPYLNLIYIRRTCFSVCLFFLYSTRSFSMPWSRTYKKFWKNYINTNRFCYKKKLYIKFKFYLVYLMLKYVT